MPLLGNQNVWRDLDDDAYRSPFGNMSCFVSVDFRHSIAQQERRWFNLPVYPENVNFNLSTNYASNEILGRAGQISAYNSTNDITSTFSLKLHRELRTLNNQLVDINHIDAIISLIQAAQYAKWYADGLYAPITTYKFGDTLLIGKQIGVQITWGETKINGCYMVATLNISMTNVSKKILNFEDVRNSMPRGSGLYTNKMNNYLNGTQTAGKTFDSIWE